MSKSGFVIVTSQRTGSSHIIRLLDQHPELRCAGEIFKREDVHNILHSEDSFDFPKKSKTLRYKLSPRHAIEQHLKKRLTAEDLKFGFKLMTSQIDEHEFIPGILSKLGFTPIILVRKNLAKQAFSHAKSRATNEWVNPGDEKTIQKQVTLDIDELSDTIDFVQASYQDLCRMADDMGALLIDYETLIKDTDETLRSICTYLGVSPEFEYKEKLKKSTAVVVKNLEEVKRCFSDRGLTLL